ncbi:vacuolar membrane protein-domain-containing protein [Phakopsora pachyrhizi]|uniref:Vaculolar membrane protein-domain-containing protein n=1 Tax=Phakopsora pachyrhizi TaxID=170000 RepID=A0AAV0BG71_PHAPC|nr:vacuolar membrane protein-domain-containing protein [Phakopsora pachyrhizi]CAH7685770.1 Vaculolar membrane protein-domain-containing protein [Phakopsora pachyrhizi]
MISIRTNSSTVIQQSTSSSSSIKNNQSCSLLGPFSILIQTFMALVILISLLIRRHREKPKRKLRIWTADVSKQIIGQAFVHFLNIFISDSLASSPTQGNPCALYFMNILIDTTLGVFILYIALRSITSLITYTFERPASSLGLLTGTYPYPFLMSWSKQLAVYLLSLVILKLVVVWMFWLGGESLTRFGDRIINGISSDGKVQVLMVVMVGPTCLNVMQFLLVDSFIKHHLEELDDYEEDEQEGLDHLEQTGTDEDQNLLRSKKFPSS